MDKLTELKAKIDGLLNEYNAMIEGDWDGFVSLKDNETGEKVDVTCLGWDLLK
jgi:hypothetical protein